jgi:hypothetical protein
MSRLLLPFLVTLTLFTGAAGKDCVGDLNSVDADGDVRLSREEYLSFVSLRSDDRLQFSSFSELPLDFVASYQFGACSCALVSTDSQCCVGEKASITLDPAAPEYNDDVLITLCRSVGKAIDSVLPATPEPTPAATPMPTPAATPKPTPAATPTPTLPAATPTPTLPAATSEPSSRPTEVTTSKLRLCPYGRCLIEKLMWFTNSFHFPDQGLRQKMNYVSLFSLASSIPKASTLTIFSR